MIGRLGNRSGRSLGAMSPWLLLAPALTLVAVLFGGGLALGVAQSLGYLAFLENWRWSTDAYRAVAADPAVRASLGLTLRVSVVSTLAATVLGVATALLVFRFRRGRRLAAALFALPLPLPHLVAAVAMLLLLGQTGLVSRLAFAAGLTGSPAEFPALTGDRFGWGIIAAYVWKESAFVGVVALAALSNGVEEFEAAARTLGAGGWQRLRHVVLPLIAPSVTAAAVLVFAFTVGSYEVPSLLGRPYPATLPVVALQYYSHPDLALRAQAMAVAVGIAFFVGVLVVGYLATVNRYLRRAA